MKVLCSHERETQFLHPPPVFINSIMSLVEFKEAGIDCSFVMLSPVSVSSDRAAVAGADQLKICICYISCQKKAHFYLCACSSPSAYCFQGHHLLWLEVQYFKRKRTYCDY